MDHDHRRPLVCLPDRRLFLAGGDAACSPLPAFAGEVSGVPETDGLRGPWTLLAVRFRKLLI